MKQGRFDHWLIFLSFGDNKNYFHTHKIKTDYRKTELYLGNQMTALTKHDSPNKHLVAEEITELFKGSVILCHYTIEKHKQFWINIYTLCDCKGHT
jgi:hypothetical protein